MTESAKLVLSAHKFDLILISSYTQNFLRNSKNLQILYNPHRKRDRYDKMNRCILCSKLGQQSKIFFYLYDVKFYATKYILLQHFLEYLTNLSMSKSFLYWYVFLLADSHNDPRSTGYPSKLPQGGMTFHGISVLTAANKSYCTSVMPPGCHMASSAVNQLITLPVS